jgi:Tol biopolymer transport system component
MQLRRERRISLPLLGALGLILGLLIAAALSAPRVRSINPQHASTQIPAFAPISITFNQRMDPDSVLDHLSVDPFTEFTSTWDEKTLTLEHDAPWPSDSTVTITLSGGARSLGLLPLLSSKTWSFSIGEPRVAYLYPAGQHPEIYAHSLGDDQGTPLTETSLGVFDFSLSHHGTLIAYSAERSDGSTDLHTLDLVSGDDRLVYSSPEGSRCETVAVSPGGDYLAFECFEFQTSEGGSLIPGPRRVWLLPLERGEQPFLAGQDDHITTAPLWSPSGALAYYDSMSIAIMIVDPTQATNLIVPKLLPSAMGNISSWSPDGAVLVFAEMVIPPPQPESDDHSQEIELDFYTHLYSADLANDDIDDLSGTEFAPVEDASPAFSPDGLTIVFARRYMDQARFTLGRQIWLMDADGSNVRLLTNDTLINHSALAWSPDSSTLAFMRFDRSNISQPAEIWVMDTNGDNPRMLVQGGYLPIWIP